MHTETSMPRSHDRSATYRETNLNRIAVITDIHGSPLALQASLAAIDAGEVEAAGLPGEYAHKLVAAA